jgi:ribonuclease HII
MPPKGSKRAPKAPAAPAEAPAQQKTHDAAPLSSRPRRAAPAAITTTTTKKAKASSGPTRDRESRLWAKGLATVAGVDEAGRGPLAGPVVAAACVLPVDASFPGLDDSKQLDEPAREALYAAITSHPGVTWCVRIEDHHSIDRINILQATLRAMRRAVEGLAASGGDGANGKSNNNNDPDTTDPDAAADVDAIPDPRARRSLIRAQADFALIDGNRMPPGLPCPAETVVGGDGKVACIAAASVIAKVTRDRIMLDLERQFPGYGLGQHKGYGVPQHVAAVRRLGPSPVHRRSFEPVKGMVGWTREGMLAAEAEAERKKKEKDGAAKGASKAGPKREEEAEGGEGAEEESDGAGRQRRDQAAAAATAKPRGARPAKRGRTGVAAPGASSSGAVFGRKRATIVRSTGARE